MADWKDDPARWCKYVSDLSLCRKSYMLSLNDSLFIIYKELINYLLTLTNPLVAVKPH